MLVHLVLLSCGSILSLHQVHVCEWEQDDDEDEDGDDEDEDLEDNEDDEEDEEDDDDDEHDPRDEFAEVGEDEDAVDEADQEYLKMLTEKLKNGFSDMDSDVTDSDFESPLDDVNHYIFWAMVMQGVSCVFVSGWLAVSFVCVNSACIRFIACATCLTLYVHTYVCMCASTTVTTAFQQHNGETLNQWTQSLTGEQQAALQKWMAKAAEEQAAEDAKAAGAAAP